MDNVNIILALSKISNISQRFKTIPHLRLFGRYVGKLLVRLNKFDAVILTYFNENLYKMAEDLQVDVMEGERQKQRQN